MPSARLDLTAYALTAVPPPVLYQDNGKNLVMLLARVSLTTGCETEAASGTDDVGPTLVMT